jgi:hypothetical protein
MANRSFKRNIATLENELVLVEGTISLSGSLIGGVAYPLSCSISHTLTGAIGTGSVGVTHPNTGSFLIVLQDVFPRLQAAQFTLFADAATNMRVVGNPNNTRMGADAVASGSSNTSQVGFYLVSGSGGVFEPTGSVQVHVSLALKNSTV